MSVQVIKNESGVEEWVIMEMQGTIEGTSLEGQMAGNLAWRKDNSEAILLIGHHLLEGKMSVLEKPLLVACATDNLEDRTMVVEGIVYRRLVFKNRPKPIVTKTLVKKSTLQ